MSFKNRVVEYPNRVTLTDGENNVIGPYTIKRDEGEVTEEGTPLTAENLNSEIAAAVGEEMSAFTLDSSGNVHFRNMQSGRATIKVKAEKQTTVVAVKFARTFTKIPIVVLTPVTSAPSACSAGVTNITTTGFSICFYRTGKINTNVNWMAFV